MENQMQVPEDFQRVYPGLKISRLISKQPGTRAHNGQELPTANRPREFQASGVLLSAARERARDKKKAKEKDKAGTSTTTGGMEIH